MRLSDALLSVVVNSFRSKHPQEANDRRRDVRTQLVGRATIMPCAAGAARQPVAVGIRDISVAGIALIQTLRVSPGDRFILLLPADLAEHGRGVVCTAAYCRPLAGGYYLVGAAFNALIPSQAADHMLRSDAVPHSTPTLPVEEMIASFRQQARNILTADEVGLLIAIERRLSSARRTAPPRSPPVTPNPQSDKIRAPSRTSALPRLMTREQCIQRAELAMGARTLSGVVAQVVTLATSPRGELADLATLVARDPLLSARILQAANSVGYASARKIVSTIPDAVRNIGCAGVRDIAAALAVFDAMPPTSPDGFNPVRCWQHSFATATLCQRLAPDDQGGTAYLVGLCHDLGEILFHTHFAAEYRQVLDAQASTGKRRDELERLMLGTSHGELVQTILRCLGLPDSIRMPIQQHHAASAASRLDAPLARILRLADLCANGAQLASSGGAPVAPLTKAEVRSAAGADDLRLPDPVSLRGEIYAMTAMLARLPAREEAAMMAQPFERQAASIWLVRDPALSPFDPVAWALESMCELKVSPALPRRSDLDQCAGLVVEARSATASGFAGPEIAAVAEGIPTLWLCGHLEGGVPTSGISPQAWPIPLASLAEFLHRSRPGLQGSPTNEQRRQESLQAA